MLADEDVEDHAVDRIVGAVVGDRPHLAFLLPEPVHPALALLVPRGVPRQVVVQHGVEVLLQVDALRQAVGAHEHEPAAGGGEGIYARFAFGGRKPAGDRLDAEAVRQDAAQVTRDVVGGVDEAAEDDRVETVLQERPDLAHGALQLAILRGGDGPGAAGELQQPAARRRTAAFRVRPGAEVEGGVVVVALVEDGAAARLVHVALAPGLVGGGPAAQGGHRGRGARRDAAQQRERRPVAHPLPAPPAAGLAHVLAGEREDVVEELAVDGAERVRGLLVPALGERGVGFEVAADVAAAALDEVAGQPAADAFAAGPVEVRRQVGEVFVEQTEERAERLVVPAVRRRRHQHEMPLRGGSEAAQEIVTLLAPAARAGGGRAAVGLVHDHELRALAGEIVGAALRLDEVGGDHREAMAFEDGGAQGQIAFETLDGARQHQFRVDVELVRQLPLPLFRQMGRAQYREAPNLAAVEQFAGDEAGLDRLADAHVVRDEHAHRVEPERHHQRHELIGPGLDGDAAEAAERTGGGAGRQARRIAQQPAGCEVAEVPRAGQPERRRLDRLHGRQDTGDLFVEPADGTEHQQFVRRFGQDDPLAAPRPDEGSRLGQRGGAHVPRGMDVSSPSLSERGRSVCNPRAGRGYSASAPKTSAWRRKTARQSAA